MNKAISIIEIIIVIFDYLLTRGTQALLILGLKFYVPFWIVSWKSSTQHENILAKFHGYFGGRFETRESEKPDIISPNLINTQATEKVSTEMKHTKVTVGSEIFLIRIMFLSTLSWIKILISLGVFETFIYFPTGRKQAFSHISYEFIKINFSV